MTAGVDKWQALGLSLYEIGYRTSLIEDSWVFFFFLTIDIVGWDIIRMKSW